MQKSKRMKEFLVFRISLCGLFDWTNTGEHISMRVYDALGFRRCARRKQDLQRGFARKTRHRSGLSRGQGRRPIFESERRNAELWTVNCANELCQQRRIPNCQ